MRLFICEKPSQAADIARFLGASKKQSGSYHSDDGTVLTWCIGHLLEQAKPEAYDPDLKFWDIKKLPVIPQKWKMVVKENVASQFKIVENLLQKAHEVVIATDADREGEVIAREVMEHVGYKGKVSRLWLSALDDSSIRKALGNLLPESQTLSLYYSGKGRARADWLGGINLTMAMTKAHSRTKGEVWHIGRVQTPTLALVVRRELQIQNFKSKTHYDLGVTFLLLGKNVPFRWTKPEPLLDKDGHITNPSNLQEIVQKLQGATGTIQKVETTEQRELAPLLFSLGTLQRAANAIYGMKAQAVLDIAQSLYEKHKATSYPRTDCEYLPTSMFADVPAIFEAIANIDPSIAKTIPKPSKPGRVFNDKKITAHHGIVPTANPHIKLSNMSEVEQKIYSLIRDRYIMQFLGDYLYQQTDVAVICQSHSFTARGKIPTSQGWKALEPKTSKPKDADDEEEAILPQGIKIEQSAPVALAEIKTLTTKPPKPYTEGTLLDAMDSIEKFIDDPRLKEVMKTKEKAGIGTDATRATIIENLFERDYLALKGKTITVQNRGWQLIDLVEKHAPEIADPALTAIWEDRLSQIEKGQLTLADFEVEMANWLRRNIDAIKASAPASHPHSTEKESLGKCPICKNNVIETQKSFSCIKTYPDKECTFSIWKTIAEKKITKELIITLLKEEKTPLIKGFTSHKKGTKFNAFLVVKKENNECKIEFEFEKK